jgi:hypothetical protein
VAWRAVPTCACVHVPRSGCPASPRHCSTPPGPSHGCRCDGPPDGSEPCSRSEPSALSLRRLRRRRRQPSCAAPRSASASGDSRRAGAYSAWGRHKARGLAVGLAGCERARAVGASRPRNGCNQVIHGSPQGVDAQPARSLRQRMSLWAAAAGRAAPRRPHQQHAVSQGHGNGHPRFQGHQPGSIAGQQFYDGAAPGADGRLQLADASACGAVQRVASIVSGPDLARTRLPLAAALHTHRKSDSMWQAGCKWKAHGRQYSMSS